MENHYSIVNSEEYLKELNRINKIIYERFNKESIRNAKRLILPWNQFKIVFGMDFKGHPYLHENKFIRKYLESLIIVRHFIYNVIFYIKTL